ncbi:MAG: DUF2520 domain-containing protein [Acidobacteriota bacterium]
MSPTALRVGIVGGGRAAQSLAPAWQRDRSLSVMVWARRAAQARLVARRARVRRCDRLDELASAAQVVVLAVPDDAIAMVARQLAPLLTRPIVVLHLAGAWPARSLLSSLAANRHSVGVLHPLLPLVGSAPTRPGLADISGDRRAVTAAKRLARAADLEAHVIADSERALLHVACVLAAGDLTALLASSIEWLTRAGLKPAVARRAALGLAYNAVANLEGRSASDALTGPAMRGDLATLQHHEQALKAQRVSNDGAAIAHRWLSAITIAIGVGSKRITPARASQMLRALGLPRGAAGRTLRPARRLARPKGSL